MTKDELNKAPDSIVVDATLLRNLYGTLQRTDTGAFRDAQNIMFLLIDRAEPLQLPNGGTDETHEY